GLVAVVIAAVLALGGGGLVLARSLGTHQGAGSPEAAVDGLLGAIGRHDLKAAAGYLQGEERRAFDLYGDRVAKALASRGVTSSAADPLSGYELTFSGVTTHRVAGSGDAAVVEITGGTVA